MSKVILVTGASSGFGERIAAHLAARGHTVYGTGRRGADGRPQNAFRMIEMDVRQPASVNRAVQQVIGETGRIDVLVNNAGVSMIGPLEEASPEDIDVVMDTNVYGVLRVCRAVLPDMRARGDGLIINIGSLAGRMGLPCLGVYSTSKFALEGLTESLSLEVRPFGIKVCIVEPGDFKTGILENRRKRRPSMDSPYRSFFDKVAGASQHKMETAPSPAAMGPFIEKILNSRKPALRYQIGSTVEKLSTIVKQLVPGRLFEKIILSYYR